jgi:ABC-type phosphate transport system substrate-binding protein
MRYSLPLLALVLLLALIAPLPVRTEPHDSVRYPLALSSGSPAFQEDLAIIVNKTNPIEAMTLAELRDVFLAERSRWPNGRKVTITMLDIGNPERDVVLRTIYRMREADFNRNFLRARFAGETTEEPKLLASPTNMVRFVFNAPGAIGYVRASSLDGSVKVLRIDGRAPGEQGYRIRF